MNKKLWFVGMLAAVMVFSAGCGQKPGAAPGDTTGQNTEGTPSPGVDPDQQQPAEGNNQTGTTNGAGTGEVPQDDKKTETIKVYYTDPELLELKNGSVEITFKNDSEKYEAAFKALKTSDQEDLVPLWEKVELLSSSFADGKLTLDLQIPAEAHFGAGGESFAVDAIKNTFFQFEEVKSLQLLVDGKQVESLMGHVELQNPETR